MQSFINKKVLSFLGAGLFFIIFCFCVYKFGLPTLVSSNCFKNFVSNQVSKTLNADIIIEKPNLKTGVEVSFVIDKFCLIKDKKELLALSNIDTLFSLKDIFKRRIIVKKLLAEDVYVDAYNLTKLIPSKEKKEVKKSFINMDFYNVLLGVKKCVIDYNNPDFDLNFKARHMVFDRTQDTKYLHFDFDFELKKADKRIFVSANDKNRIFMENHAAYVKDFPIEIDSSKIIINAFMDRKGNHELHLSAKNFDAQVIANAVISDIFIQNGSKILEPIDDIQGNVDFDLSIKNSDTKGRIKVNQVDFKVVQLLRLPIKITQGFVDIGNKDIIYTDFNGFYNNKLTNKLSMKGETKDYQKTCETKILSDIYVTDDFFKNYLSKMLGYRLGLVGDAGSKLIFKSKNGICDILWFFKLDENEGFKFGDQSMILKEYKTLFKVDLSLVKNILKINTINYYITNELKRGIKPILTANGNIDIAHNMKLLDLNLDIPRPLPSEILNFLSCQNIFKKGQVAGHMFIDNRGLYPYMNGEFTLDKVLIPAQRIFIKSAKLLAAGDRIQVVSDGRFKRSSYNFNGSILNELRLPIIIKDVDLMLDNVDVEKILAQPPSQNNSSESIQKSLVSTGEENEENKEALEFVKGLVVIEKSSLNVKKGIYKELNFGNIHADMTLDKDGNIDMQSNKFDIAGGHSTLKIKANLADKKYYLRLGVKDVDSNIMASSILGLPRQISGKAKGLIELNTDSSLQLNGDIKFKIENGSIEQIGYVEYILKAASLFRNPLAMISPSAVIDLVSIPDGRFDEINGEMKLKDNIVERMKIESTADELATLIFGRYNLNTNDAMLRVYTKFSDKSKGFAGVLRNISLNTLASSISISSRNDSNYYANELSMIPKLKAGDEKAQVFLTKVDGDILNYNFLSSLKRIK